MEDLEGGGTLSDETDKSGAVRAAGREAARSSPQAICKLGERPAHDPTPVHTPETNLQQTRHR